MASKTETVPLVASAYGGFPAQLEALRKDLQGGRTIDYNGLSPTGKQVALALRDEGTAAFAIREKRRVVKQSFLAKHPFLRGCVHFITAGLWG